LRWACSGVTFELRGFCFVVWLCRFWSWSVGVAFEFMSLVCVFKCVCVLCYRFRSWSSQTVKLQSKLTLASVRPSRLAFRVFTSSRFTFTTMFTVSLHCSFFVVFLQLMMVYLMSAAVHWNTGIFRGLVAVKPPMTHPTKNLLWDVNKLKKAFGLGGLCPIAHSPPCSRPRICPLTPLGLGGTTCRLITRLTFTMNPPVKFWLCHCMGSCLWDMEHHLLYRITQCYLPPNAGERVPH